MPHPVAAALRMPTMRDMDPDPASGSTAGDITRLLQRVAQGESGAAEELYQQVYDELHRLARRQMKGALSGQTLQPTALVGEAWLRLEKAGADGGYKSRQHFLAVASRAMRSALVDQARRRNAEKRGGARKREPLELAVDLYEERCVDLLALDDALEQLGAEEPRQSKVVEMRFFGGLTMREIADSLGVSGATVDRDWQLARIFLQGQLKAG